MTANNPSVITTRRRKLRLISLKLRDSKILARARARTEARGQAADRNANRDEDREKDKCLLAELPVHASRTDAQLDIIMTDAIPEHEMHQGSPFFELPPEIRCLIYEQVFNGIVEDAEAFAGVRQSNGRAYQSAFVRLNVNALPHTCRIIRNECMPIFEELSCEANHSRIDELEDLVLLDTDPSFFGPPWNRSQELEDFMDEETDAQLAQGLGPTWDESQVAAALCRMRALVDIDRVVLRITLNIVRYQWRQKWHPIISKFWDICIGVQNRLHDGAGVRKAFEAEIRAQVDVEATDDDVALLLDFYVGDFANLITPRRPPRVIRLARFGQRVQQACWSSQVMTQESQSGKTSRKRTWRNRRLCNQPRHEQQVYVV